MSLDRPSADSPERVRALMTLYRETHYDVIAPSGPGWTLRVGDAPPEGLVDWLARDSIAIFITACNPYSRPLSSAENARRLSVLREQLNRRSFRVLTAVGRMPGEQWQEPSVLVAALSIDGADALAREHGQNSILVIEPRKAVQLRMYRPDWHAHIGELPHVAWAPDAPT